MNSTRLASIGLAAALAVTLPIAPAQAAGAPRTFLSAAGSDSNNCTNVASPCRHLAAAFAATAPDGEIYVLDPANYGSLTITHAVSIEGHGWASIAPPSGGNAITINANPGDAINIIGVVLDGTAVANTNGIVFNSGGSLTVRDSVVRNFTLGGIALAPTVSSTFKVSNTMVSDNFGDGIYLQPHGNINVTAVFNRVEVYKNGFKGIGIFSNIGGSVSATAVDCVAANNDIGYYALGGPPGATAFFRVSKSTAANNNIGIAAEAGGEVTVSQSEIEDNIIVWTTINSGSLFTYGDNVTFGTSPPSNSGTVPKF
jgi:hypothetical protein